MFPAPIIASHENNSVKSKENGALVRENLSGCLALYKQKPFVENLILGVSSNSLRSIQRGNSSFQSNSVTRAVYTIEN